MRSTNPQSLLPTLHLIRAGLASGLLSREAVIDWADTIITRDEAPDAFFIDLALSSSKTTNEIIHYLHEYLNFENPVVPGRPLLGLLYQQYLLGQISLDQAVSRLFRLKSEALFHAYEVDRIYSLENDYDAAGQGIYGSLSLVRQELETFLAYYKGYTIDNQEGWPALDEQVDRQLEEDARLQSQKTEQYAPGPGRKRRGWWKFW